MRKCSFLLLGLILAAFQAIPQDKEKGSRTLKVNVHYTGEGPVDEKHKIFIVVFDSPEFVKGEAMPIAVQTATAKDQGITFSEIATSPVYVATSYDPTGNYDGQSGPPPSGASLGMYSKNPGTPEPINIEAGKTAEVDLSFDDSFKMP